MQILQDFQSYHKPEKADMLPSLTIPTNSLRKKKYGGQSLKAVLRTEARHCNLIILLSRENKGRFLLLLVMFTGGQEYHANLQTVAADLETALFLGFFFRQKSYESESYEFHQKSWKGLK